MTTQNTTDAIDMAVEGARKQVEYARRVLNDAEVNLETALDLQRKRNNRLALADALRGDLHCATPGFKGRADYILPLGRDYEGINPFDPSTFPFGGAEWAANGVAYLLKKDERTRPTRLVFSGGGMVDTDRWGIGAQWDCRHDQTGARLGNYTVVGIVIYDGEGNVARYEGDVPDRRIKGAVFK
jgi:hypothetical protein